MKEEVPADGDNMFLVSLMGMTKREYFAAMAMQGLLSKGCSVESRTASLAVMMASELLEALDE